MDKVTRVQICSLISLFLLMVPGSFLSALPSDAESILGKAHLFGNSRYLSLKVDMQIKTSSGDKTRGIDISISNNDNDYKVYMQIINPTFLRKMKFLQYNFGNKSTLQWIATSRGARKITSSGNDEKIFDSDFTASDFASINMSNYQIEKFSESVRNEVQCYRFDLTAIQNSELINKKVLFIDRDSYLIREVEYYRENKLVKRYLIISTQNIDGRIFPLESQMENLNKGSSTKLIFQKIEMPNSISDRVFHYRNL